MKKTQILLAFLVLLAIAACKKDNDSETLNNNSDVVDMPYVLMGNRLTPAGEKDQSGEFGGNVVISRDGSTVAVTAYEHDAVYIYKKAGNDWIEEKAFYNYEAPEEIALSADGNVLVIRNEDRGFEHTYILTRENSIWSENIDISGHSKSIAVSGNGDIVLIGGYKSIKTAQGESEEWMGAIVFNRSGKTWHADTILGWPADDPVDFYHTIGKLAISDDGGTILVCENRIINGWFDFNGQVNIFKISGGKWVQEAKALKPSNSGLNFGRDISISKDGNTIAFGSEGTVNGEVFVFSRSLGFWTQFGGAITGNLDRAKFVAVGNNVSLSSDGYDLVTTGSLDGNGWLGEDVIFHYSLINGSWKQQRDYVFDDDLSLTSYSDISLSGDAQTLISGTTATLGNSDGYIQFYTKK